MKNNTKEIITFLYNLEYMNPSYPTKNIIYDIKSKIDSIFNYLDLKLKENSKTMKKNYRNKPKQNDIKK